MGFWVGFDWVRFARDKIGESVRAKPEVADRTKHLLRYSHPASSGGVPVGATRQPVGRSCAGSTLGSSQPADTFSKHRKSP
jgi:hypothetical protein